MRKNTTSPLSRSLTLTDLLPNTVYRISIGAATLGGMGVFSEEIEKRTLEDGKEESVPNA